MANQRWSRRSLAVDVALGVLLGVAGFVSGLSPADFPQSSVGVALLMGLAGGVQVLRRIRPMTAFTVSMSAMAAVALLFGHYESGGSLLITLVAAYSVVVYGSNLPFAAAGLAAFSAALNLGQPLSEAVGDLAFSFVLSALAVGAGLAVRAMRDRARVSAEERATLQREQEAAAAQAAEEERRRLARELHDILSHGLGVIALQASAAEHALEADPARARAAIGAIRTATGDAIAELGALVRTVGADAPEGRAPQPTLSDLPRLVEQATEAGFVVDWAVEGRPRPVPPAVQASVFRVVQEGLANAMKHSGSQGCRLVLRYLDEDVQIEVLDEGTRSMEAAGTRRGLAGIRERVSVFGGSVHAGPREEGGWALVAAFPSTQ